MRILTGIMIAFMAAVSCPAQVCIDGRTMAHDSGTGVWLCSVPQAWFGTDHLAKVTIAPGSQWSDVEIDGIPVTADGTEVTFAALDGTTSHTLHAMPAPGTLCYHLQLSDRALCSYQLLTLHARLYHPLLGIRLGSFLCCSFG